MNRIAIGILPNAHSAGLMMNSLTEADFDTDSISVVSHSEQVSRTMADDTGPLQGATGKTFSRNLIALGVTQRQIHEYEGLLEEGHVLIAVAIDDDTEDEVMDMFVDYHASLTSFI